MYEWVIMLVLIFGGAGFVAKVLFSDAYKEEKHKDRKHGKSESNTAADSLDEEIERMKKGLKIGKKIKILLKILPGFVYGSIFIFSRI